MALALYRRYRPDTFDGIIGQKQVTVPLSRALDQGKLTHAYLFSGPRGCGKTSSARILARCINCEKGPTSHPCGECASCKDLATGGPGSIDVVEIDAASHNGVDDARELRERAAFAPARDRYKIFILDEAHMVTAQGFNALLKIVEEPPEHVMFIFATTEPDKVISTIRSRTHHYPFRLVPEEVMGPYLEQVCAEEKIEPEPGVLKLAMRAGGGSVRDTLSVLDQLMVGAVDGKISYDSAVALLGFTPDSLIGEAINAVVNNEGEALYAAIEKVVTGGFEPRRFVEDLLARVRDLLVLTLGGEQAAKALGDDSGTQDIAAMRRQASALGLPALTAMAEIIDGALADMAGATSPRMRLELLAARLLAGREQGFAPQVVASQQPAVAQAAAGSGFVGAGNRAGNSAAPGGNASQHRGGFVGAQHNGAAGRADAGPQSSRRNESAAVSGNAGAHTVAGQGAGHTVQSAPGVASQGDVGPSHAPDAHSDAGSAGFPTGPAASAARNDASGKDGSTTLSVAERRVQENVGKVDPSASADDKWAAVLKSLPEGVSEYVDRSKVPHVVLQTNEAGRSRLAMTFDTALSQHAFALAIASDSDNNGKKASHVVLETVRAVFGRQTMIAPTPVAANGEKVVSTNRMKPEELAQVKRKIALAKAGLAPGGAVAESTGHEASEHKEQKKSSDGSQEDADGSSHRGAASRPVSVPASSNQGDFDDDDPWAHQLDEHGVGGSAGGRPVSESSSDSSSERKAKKHIAVPDISDGVDPWAVPSKPQSAGTAQAGSQADSAGSGASQSVQNDASPLAGASVATYSGPQDSMKGADRQGSASDMADPRTEPPSGSPAAAVVPASGGAGVVGGTREERKDGAGRFDAQARPMPNFDDSAGSGPGGVSGRPTPQVAAEDDDYSLDDQSLGSATAMSIGDLSQLFEVKKVEEFSADDPQNPKNIKNSSHRLSDGDDRGRK